MNLNGSLSNYNQFTNYSFDVIISRYKENINWISEIYNLPYLKLPNVGREAHTYLYHVTNNYDNLNTINIFLQGHPFDHCPNLLDKIKDIYTKINDINIDPMSSPKLENKYSVHRNHKKIHPKGLYISYFMKLLFDINTDIAETIAMTYGAQFACSKESIISKPKNFYEFLLNFVSYETNPIEAYIFERLWLYIFDKNIDTNNKYKLWMKSC
jgi:hypothetical protein